MARHPHGVALYLQFRRRLWRENHLLFSSEEIGPRHRCATRASIGG